ncbi:hypothetical protein MTO96_011813 [Rhipicephalus appendiculatus]
MQSSLILLHTMSPGHKGSDEHHCGITGREEVYDGARHARPSGGPRWPPQPRHRLIARPSVAGQGAAAALLWWRGGMGTRPGERSKLASATPHTAGRLLPGGASAASQRVQKSTANWRRTRTTLGPINMSLLLGTS